MDSNAIEKKWSRRWAEEKVFETDPDPKKEKRYITAAFPYPNSPQHIGHARTYTTADIYARYLRLKGYHVLFPMAFHVTGTPILAMAKRIAAKDPEVLGVFEKIYGISPEKAASLSKPKPLVKYFSEEIEQGMKEIGYSIDWRRKFYSYDEKFNKFIQWQFRKLKEFGYLIKGEYPIAWCPNDNQAVGAHDTKGDVDPELKEFTAVKFAFEGGYLLTATLRPETIYGVTNIWVNPDNIHVKAKSRKTGEIYHLSKKAYEKMNYQNLELEILDEFKGKAILGKTAKNLITNEEIPIYEGKYVKEDEGTGIVMSVPSHAPYDHIALLDLGIHLDYTQIIKVEGYHFMAKELIEERGIKDQHDPKLEEIVKEVYKKEILTGTMLVGPHKGERVSVAIEKTKQDMLANNQALVFWELSNKPVYCRCGSHITVNILGDQWFIDYGISDWKDQAKQCLGAMSIIPENTRGEFDYTINWLKTRPCARAAGLGTKFPFDETKMIEALSDSTVYMAFYTISHLLNDIDVSEMDDKFFDYVFLGKGKGDKKLKKLRESFLYWYPVDSRHSAGDLIRNHLTLYIFNHVALFEKKLWPQQIVTNGFVLMDGCKMSKSIGNILPLRKAIQEYGADVVRFAVVSGADLSSDSDFNNSVAEGVRSRLISISKLIRESKKAGKPHGRIERWLLSRLNRKIDNAEKLYEKLTIRHLGLEIFYDVASDLHWYMKRTEKPNLHDFFEKWIVLIAPFMPHHAEEYWEMLGGKGFVSFAKFPKADHSKINDSIEQGEEIIKKIHGDIEKISELIGKKPSSVTIYVAADWKRKLYAIAQEQKAFDKIMKAVGEAKLPMKEAQAVVKQIIRNVHSLPDVLSTEDELATLKDAERFLSKEYECKVIALLEDEGKHPKAKAALPGKPAIILE
ncbi:leucine--tRNA ligase [Candidatus Micrarchaeota archaeon]|nr:leucine--tRNA ligase [Candidatus Micrarchaeota archaeon]